MAPEQFAGVSDARSDQYGFCACFFEVFYGKPMNLPEEDAESGIDQAHLVALTRAEVERLLAQS